MATPDHLGNNTPQTTETEQYALSKTFDQRYQLMMVGLGAYNPNTNSYDRVQINDSGQLVTSSAGGSGGGGDASAANQLTEITRLTSIRDNQTNGTQHTLVDNFPAQTGLTDAQLRANRVPVDIGSATVTVNASDVEIGAVEIKDADTETRVKVTGSTPTGTENGVVTRNIPSGTQPISATALPLPTGAATSAKQLPDGHNVTITNPVTSVAVTSIPEIEIKNDTGNPVGTVDANKQGLKFYAQILTGSTTITPTTGKGIKLLKVQVLQSPDNSSGNPVTLSFASTGNFITGWAYSDSSEVTGATNEALNIALSNAQAVSVNVRYKEV